MTSHKLDEFELLAAWERIIREPALNALSIAQDLNIEFDTPVVFMVTISPTGEVHTSIDTRHAVHEETPR